MPSPCLIGEGRLDLRSLHTERFGGWGVAGADGGDEAGDGAGGESDEWGGEDGGWVDGGGPSACGAGGDDAE